MPISSDEAKASAEAKAVSRTERSPLMGETERAHVLAQLLAKLKIYPLPTLPRDLDGLVEQVVQSVQRTMTAGIADQKGLTEVISEAVFVVGDAYTKATIEEQLKTGSWRHLYTPRVESQPEQAQDGAMADPDSMKEQFADLRAYSRESVADMKVRAAEMDANFAKLTSTLESGFSKIGTDMANLRADVHKSQSEMKGWVVATVLAILFGFGALVYRLPSGSSAAPVTAPNETAPTAQTREPAKAAEPPPEPALPAQ